MTQMKSITNKAGQGKFVLLIKNSKPEQVYLKPSETIVVPETWVSHQVKNLAQMKLLSITNY
tara:strand:- start:2241 stop:2426 length:186 start_codon:yes stop_codon:yes gene_type:complete